MKVLMIGFLAALIVGLSEPSYLNGKHLRIGFVESPPDIYTDWNAQENRTEFRGNVIDLLQWMAKRGNFSFNMVTIDYSKRFNGLPEQFEKKELDAAFVTFVVSHERSLIARFTVPLARIAHTLVIQYPKNMPNIWSIFKPYSTTVWLCFVGAAVAMVFLLGYFAHVKRRLFKSVQQGRLLTYEGAYTYVVGVTTNQGGTCFSEARSVRLLAAFWCLAAVVLVNGFSGSLITYLMAPNLSPLVNSLKDMENKSEPQILTLKPSFLQSLFDAHPFYATIRENYMKYPNNFCGQLEEKEIDRCIAFAKEGAHVLAVETGVADIIINQEFRQTKSCELTTMKEEYEGAYVAAVLPFDSTHKFRNSIDALILESANYGLLSKWYEDYHPKDTFCAKYWLHKEQSIRKLALKDLTSAFVVLAIGYGFALIALLYEHFRTSMPRR